MTYRGLAALIAKMPEERKNSEALILTSGQWRSIYNIADEFILLGDSKLDGLHTSFDDEHPVLQVED